MSATTVVAFPKPKRETLPSGHVESAIEEWCKGLLDCFVKQRAVLNHYEKSAMSEETRMLVNDVQAMALSGIWASDRFRERAAYLKEKIERSGI